MHDLPDTRSEYWHSRPHRSRWPFLLWRPSGKINRTVVGAWSAAGALVAATLFSAVAAAQNAAPMTVNRSRAATALYWTPDRMAAAIPADIQLSGSPSPGAAAAEPTGTPGLAGGLPPTQSTPTQPTPMRRSAVPKQSPSTTEGPIPLDGPYPGPHDTFEWTASYYIYPVSTVGKLFFTEPGIGDFVCSAAPTYGGAALNIIWTAGHCVANGGAATFYTNWLFCPSYYFGPDPGIGCWSWNFATTSNEWFFNGASTRDYAIIGLTNCGTVICSDVVPVTGGLGFAWNWARDQHWFHLGYPAAAPYDGQRIITTAAEHRYDDTPDGLGPPTNSWGDDQTGGSSGSSVQLFFNLGTAGGPYINSNVSYGYGGLPGETYGPYFDTQVCNFWAANTGYGGGC
jgi:hypothetical protein